MDKCPNCTVTFLALMIHNNVGTFTLIDLALRRIDRQKRCLVNLR
eukprot:UN12271